MFVANAGGMICPRNGHEALLKCASVRRCGRQRMTKSVEGWTETDCAGTDQKNTTSVFGGSTWDAHIADVAYDKQTTWAWSSGT